MEKLYYAGLDIHKKTITVCVKDQMGNIFHKKTISSTPKAIHDWAQTVPGPFIAAIETTIFTGWIYDELVELAREVKVANSLLLEYIGKCKHKSDELDSDKLCDLLRVNMIPEVFMLPKEIRSARNLLRYRNWLVKESTRFKNKISNQLMLHGCQYNAEKLHYKSYFHNYLGSLEADANLVEILSLSRSQLELLQQFERRVKRMLFDYPEIKKRSELLQTIPGVGEITSLTWILEIWDPHRFSKDRAISYCGLCQGRNSSANKDKRGPISKKRNARIQWVLIEASKMAVHQLKVPRLVEIYEKKKAEKDHNAATIEVARKLTTWIMAVDKRGAPFINN